MGQLVEDVTSILNYRDSKKEAENERQRILADMAADEQEKTNLIKKTLATQRAKYGASGVTGRSMTTGAVLKRLNRTKKNVKLIWKNCVRQKPASQTCYNQY